MISLDKKYKTRSGYEVDLWTVDAKSSPRYKVRGEINMQGEWHFGSWNIEGSALDSCTPDGMDLVEVKPTRWVNVYVGDGCRSYPSRETADAAAANYTRIACLEFEEGDGLE